MKTFNKRQAVRTADEAITGVLLTKQKIEELSEIMGAPFAPGDFSKIIEELENKLYFFCNTINPYENE